MRIFNSRLRQVARFTHGLVPGIISLSAALVLLADVAPIAAQQRLSASRTGAARTGAAKTNTSKSGVRPTAAGANDLFPAPPLPQPSLRNTAPARANRAEAEAVSASESVELPEGAIATEGAAPAGAVPGVIGETNPGNILIAEAATKTRAAKDIGDFSEIIAMCEEGLKHKPAKENAAYAQKLCAWSYNRRGEQFSELGNEAEALKDFTAAISFDRNHWRAIHNRGVSYATLGKINEATADFTRALQINPAYANTWFNRGELRSDQQDYAKAIVDYTEALRLSPNEGEFYSRRGFAYSRSGHLKPAMSDFNTAIKLRPDDASVRLRRGEIHLTLRDWANAAADYRDAIKLDSNLGPAYLGAAWIMATCPDERFRNPEMAIKTAQRAMELEGDSDPRYTEALAAAYANAGQYLSAVAILKPLIEKLPRSQQAGALARLELYKAETPFRDGASQPVTARSRQPAPQAKNPPPQNRPQPRQTSRSRSSAR